MEEVEDFGDDEVGEVVDGLRDEVEPGVARCDDGAGEGGGAHVLDVDEGEWGFAVRDDEGSALLEGDHGGAGEEVGARAGGDGGEGGGGAGEDDHPVVDEGARGDDGADVLVGVADEARVVLVGVGGVGEVGEEGAEAEVGDVHFVGEESAAVVGDDEVDGAARGEEEVEESDGVGCARSAGDPEDDDFARIVGEVGGRGCSACGEGHGGWSAFGCSEAGDDRGDRVGVRDWDWVGVRVNG